MKKLRSNRVGRHLWMGLLRALPLRLGALNLPDNYINFDWSNGIYPVAESAFQWVMELALRDRLQQLASSGSDRIITKNEFGAERPRED